MILLAAADDVPYGQVATIVGALVTVVLALASAVVLLWRQSQADKADRIEREKAIGAEAKADGATIAKALADAAEAARESTEALRAVVGRLDAADAVRRDAIRDIERALETLAADVKALGART